MRNDAWQKGVVLLSMLAIGAAGLSTRARQRAETDERAQKPEQQKAVATTLEKRIERVESGLLPAVVLKGETPPRMSLNERMKFYTTPGVTVAVINEGKVEWARGYGLLKVNGQQRVTTETMFQAASISKTFTAIAALQLVEKHKLNLDEDVNIKLSTWKIPESDLTKTEKPTLRRVLSHTAGLSVGGFLGYTIGQPVPTLQQLLNGEKPANTPPVRINMVPGLKFSYSGGGYEVLEQLLIDVSGTSFTDLMQPILKKLRMSRSTFISPSAGDSDVASGHFPNGKEIEGGWFMHPQLAAAGLWSTPTDLAQLVIEIQKSNEGKSNRLLSRDMTKLMVTPQIENIGLGVMVEGQGPSARFISGGSNVGYKSYAVGYLQTGQGAVVMTNSENGGQLAFEILRIISAEYGWPDYRPKERLISKSNPATYDDYVGQYVLGVPGPPVIITREGDKLISQGPQQPKAELLPESPNTFFLREVDASFTFVRDEKGQVVEVIIRRGGRDYKAKRIR
jgi:CubicO group peptidase (beta-lactamase class C family)